MRKYSLLKAIIYAQLFLEEYDDIDLNRLGASQNFRSKVLGVCRGFEKMFSTKYLAMSHAEDDDALVKISDSMDGAVKALAQLEPIQWEMARLALEEIKEKELA